MEGANRRAWGGLEFVRVPAGKFLMGSKEDNPLASGDEKQQHTVEIAGEYWIGRYPVTNAQFALFVQATGYRTTAQASPIRKGGKAPAGSTRAAQRAISMAKTTTRLCKSPGWKLRLTAPG